MSGSPRISVIDLAFNRKNYLVAGVASALDQTLPRDRYEILVYKNFEDAEIDAYLQANDVRTFTSDPSTRPRTLRTVLQDARGELLCFLDDDDLFTQDKLAFVDRTFSEDPTLGYLHNGFIVVDDNLRPFEQSPFVQPHERVYLPAGDGRTRPIPSNALNLLGYNTSSVSVRRDWLLPFLPLFESRDAELSDLMFLGCALASGCGFLADPTKLTYYRYHKSWSNILHYSLESVESIVEFDTLNLGALNLIEKAATNTPLAPLIADGKDYVRFHRSLFVDGADWRPRPRDFVRFLVGGFRQRDYAAFYLVPLHVFSKISPIHARKAYFLLAERYRHFSFQASSGT